MLELVTYWGLRASAALLMIGVLVVVHEFGHFVFAKLFKVGVPVFSVGMGPRLFGVRIGETDYRVSMLPVGGYVQMEGADPFGEEDLDYLLDEEESENSFPNKPVWQRLLIMLGGPGFNLALPFVLFTAVLMMGEPAEAPVLGLVYENSPAEELNLQRGDRIVSVDGETVDVWPDVVLALRDRAEVGAELAVERDGNLRTVRLDAEDIALDGLGMVNTDVLGFTATDLSSQVGLDSVDSPAGRAGLRTGDVITEVDGRSIRTWTDLETHLTPEQAHDLVYLRAEDTEVATYEANVVPDPTWIPLVDDGLVNAWGLASSRVYVGGLVPDSAAEEAGFQLGDRIVAVDGASVTSWRELVRLVRNTVSVEGPEAMPREVDVTYVRDGAVATQTLLPRVFRELQGVDVVWRPVIGVYTYRDAFISGEMIQKRYTLGEAAFRASDETQQIVETTVTGLGRLLTGVIKPQESLGGPIQIIRMAGDGAEEGWFVFLRMMGVLSISLGVLNLLPVPALDGGQIFFCLVELLRGRPLSLELREKAQIIGVLALMALMLMVTVFDISRWLSP